MKDYHAAGGPPRSGGVYIPRQKVFLAPLDLMGLKATPSGWKKVSKEDFDVSVIVHELTHMLTHDMLDNLPLWVNEGFAEYMAGIPFEANSFKVGEEKIKEGVQDRFVREFERMRARGNMQGVKLKGNERRDFLKSDAIPHLFRVARVLKMTDADWDACAKSDTTTPGQAPKMARLYRTAHLIIYYFIQIEGEKGVTKIRRFLDENRRQLSRHSEYLRDLRIYQKQMAEFMKLPGVVKMEDGRIRYPSKLTPPKPPVAPAINPNSAKASGLSVLLDGETAEVVGKRIEAALNQNLGMNLRFVE